MKLNLKKMMDKADDDIFSELISACEGKMSEPFKKKAVVVEAEPEESDETLDDESEEEPKSKLADLSEEELEQLKQLYSKLKG